MSSINVKIFGGTFMGITSLTITLASRVKPKAQLQVIGELTTVYALGQIIRPIVAAYLQKNFNILAPSLFAVVMLLLALLVLMTLTINKKIGDALMPYVLILVIKDLQIWL